MQGSTQCPGLFVTRVINDDRTGQAHNQPQLTSYKGKKVHQKSRLHNLFHDSDSHTKYNGGNVWFLTQNAC